MKKRFVSLLLAMLLCLAMLPTAALAKGPEVGLYYQQEGRDGWGPYQNGPICMAPYVDMNAYLISFWNGSEYIPAEGVTSSNNAYEVFHRDDLPDGMYLISPHDFTDDCQMTYTAAGGDAYTIDLTTRMPLLAFYSGTTVSKDNFRMYQIMSENTDTSYADYRYASTLYVLSSDENFTFAEQNDISCTKKFYDSNGYEVDEQTYTDFDYACVRSDDGKMLTVTFYANDSDLLLWVRGNTYGAYVNFLAPADGAALYFNLSNQGFASSKYLPEHVFTQMSAMGGGLTRDRHL